jgi:hypothetical protein
VRWVARPAAPLPPGSGELPTLRSPKPTIRHICLTVRLASMCRSIKTLRGTEPTDEEVKAAALQLVRKVSGYRKPSKANEAVFDTAVDEVAETLQRLLDGLATPSQPR